MGDEPVLTNAVVVCHTPGCENADVPVAMPVADAVICGPCGQPIADVTPVEA